VAKSVKKLRLIDLIVDRSGTLVFRILLFIFGVALQLFFRRIETVNADSVPKGTGVIFVMNHPNGLIDPALVFVALPRKISFLAKSTLFHMPVLSFLLKTVEALPVYRKIDAGADVSKNLRTFELARERLQQGGSIALFPEGISHNSTKLLPAKTGAARIALGAVSVPSEKPIDLKIVPVGLFYTSKTTFRSEALLYFGEPFTVEAIELDSDGQPPREESRALTERIESALREVTVNAETESDLHTARIAEEIFSTAASSEALGEKMDFLQAYIAQQESDGVYRESPLRRKMHEFDQTLDRYGIGPEHLSLAQYSRGFVIRQALARTWWLFMLLPMGAVGAVLHFPAYQLSRLFAMWYAQHGADDVASTAKVLAGMLFMPATWLITAGVTWYFFGWKIALAAIPISALLGYIALYTLERFEDLRGWANAVSLFLTKRETFLRLFVERRDMQRTLAAVER
jgi:glycerol-3-phosphate O-acyltransferase/dihydroxyacetone phosphate acyltransferase